MIEFLIISILSELVIVIGVLFAFCVYKMYKHIIPKSPFDEYEYDKEEFEEEVFAPLNKELFDEGFIEDQNAFDSRISDMEERLKRDFNPAVEIITDEYEKQIER